MIPVARPHRPDPQLHPLAAKPPGGHGPRHVGARARLGAVVHPRPGRRRHRIHGARRLPLQVRRPDRVATDRPLADRGRGPRALGVPRQRAAPLHDPLRRSPQQTIDYLAKIAERAPRRGGRLRRRRREVRHLAGNQETRLRRRLAGAVLRRPGAEPAVDPSDHAGRGVRQRAAGGQDLPARLQLPRDDRMGAAHRAAGRVRADRARDAGRSALAGAAAVRPRRLLAELQGEVSRSRRNVLPA